MTVHQLVHLIQLEHRIHYPILHQCLKVHQIQKAGEKAMEQAWDMELQQERLLQLVEVIIGQMEKITDGVQVLTWGLLKAIQPITLHQKD